MKLLVLCCGYELFINFSFSFFLFFLELALVGQETDALQLLHDVITNKRNRTWQQAFETIMMKHIELVVDMRKAKMAKEALHQYKNLCQNTNIESIQKVRNSFYSFLFFFYETNPTTTKIYYFFFDRLLKNSYNFLKLKLQLLVKNQNKLLLILKTLKLLKHLKVS